MEDAYAHILSSGSSLGIEDRMMGFEQFTDILGLKEKYALDEKYRSDK